MANNWELNLAQGEWFEDNVALPWLLENWSDWWLTDCRLEKKSKLGGPKMYKGHQSITLPDFRLDNPNNGQTVWIDAKYKDGSFKLDKYPGEKFTSVDPRSYQDYKTFMNIWPNSPFFILFGNKRTKRLYMLDLKSKQPVMHKFNNQYVRKGRNLTPCFPELALECVGNWDPSLMPF